MPEIGKIQSTNFQALLTRLGITRNQVPFALQSEVVPAVLVGGEVEFVVVPPPAYEVTDVFTAGQLTNPAGGTILADTGPLPRGPYNLNIFISAAENNVYTFELRNAADAADLWTQLIGSIERQLTNLQLRIFVANDNERFRIRTFGGSNVGIVYQATIMARI